MGMAQAMMSLAARTIACRMSTVCGGLARRHPDIAAKRDQRGISAFLTFAARTLTSVLATSIFSELQIAAACSSGLSWLLQAPSYNSIRSLALHASYSKDGVSRALCRTSEPAVQRRVAICEVWLILVRARRARSVGAPV